MRSAALWAGRTPTIVDRYQDDARMVVSADRASFALTGESSIVNRYAIGISSQTSKASCRPVA